MGGSVLMRREIELIEKCEMQEKRTQPRRSCHDSLVVYRA